MKIYNVFDYNEKLKVRPVSARDLNTFSFTYEKLKDDVIDNMILDDLKDGYIVVTCYDYLMRLSETNVWIKINGEKSRKFFKASYGFEYGSVVRPEPSNPSGLTYLSLDKYSTSFPNHYRSSEYDFKEIFKTDIDTSWFSNPRYLVEFYEKSRIKEIIYENL